MIREFYPGDIRNKIKVYRDGEQIKPLMATCLYMADKPNEEVDGWVDLVWVLTNDEGVHLTDEYGNPYWIIADTQLEDDWYAANNLAKTLGIKPLPRPEPAIVRKYGKIKWEIDK